MLLSGEMERRHALVGNPELWRMKRAFQLDFLQSSGIKPKHFFLDMGCGTLRGGIPLIDFLEKGRYYGIDVREEVLEEARSELSQSGLQGKKPQLLLVTDPVTAELGKKFDYIWSFSVLIHMTDEILEASLAFAARHLQENGVFFANVNVGDADDGEWQGFPVVTRPLSFYRNACRSHGLDVEDIGSLKSLGHISGKRSQDAQRMLRMSVKSSDSKHQVW
nr:class I SAM-dependent methyltransferase [Wenzhouxiangella sp. XN201]